MAGALNASVFACECAAAGAARPNSINKRERHVYCITSAMAEPNAIIQCSQA